MSTPLHGQIRERILLLLVFVVQYNNNVAADLQSFTSKLIYKQWVWRYQGGVPGDTFWGPQIVN